MQKIPLALLCTLFTLSAHPANGLRCGSDLVSVGDYKFEIRAKCGEPVDVEQWTEYRVVPGPFSTDPPPVLRGSPSYRYPPVYEKAYIPVHIEQWIYNFGPHRLMQQLLFENGRLIDIRSLGYGYPADQPPDSAY